MERSLCSSVLIVMLTVMVIPVSNAIDVSKKTPLASVSVDNCRPLYDSTMPQFIVGYGSLMQEKSKAEDAAEIGPNFPIYVKGFERGWIEHGTDIGFSTTYLGVTANASARMNAVYFKLNNPLALANYDKREDTYCRVGITPEHIQTLSKDPLPQGQFWIYTTKTELKSAPAARYPIVETYVDIFLSGCFELEKKYHLEHFARDCVRTTKQWSNHWVNDRPNPRTAWDNDEYVSDIDPLLAKELPDYFNQIKIE